MYRRTLVFFLFTEYQQLEEPLPTRLAVFSTRLALSHTRLPGSLDSKFRVQIRSWFLQSQMEVEFMISFLLLLPLPSTSSRSPWSVLGAWKESLRGSPVGKENQVAAVKSVKVRTVLRRERKMHEFIVPLHLSLSLSLSLSRSRSRSLALALAG